MVMPETKQPWLVGGAAVLVALAAAVPRSPWLDGPARPNAELQAAFTVIVE